MVPAAGDVLLFRFSTDGLPPAQRLPRWHEALNHALGGRRVISPSSDGPFHVAMTAHELDRAGSESGTRTGVGVTRMTATILGSIRRCPDGNDDILLIAHETGRRVAAQCGREVTVAPGGGVLMSNADPCLTFVPGPEPSRFAIVSVPRKPMMAVAPRLEDALMRPLPSDTGVLRLLMRYLDTLDDGQVVGTASLQRAVATHIHDLVALAVGATRDAAELACGRGLRAARLRAIKADVTRGLADGRPSVAALAARQRVTPRYIHKLFESEGTTLSKFVLGLRLARVHRMLTDPRHAHLTIGAVAYDAGFGDLSTFNREFRRQFGATPSDVRAAAART